jgi:hypothetical protein
VGIGIENVMLAIPIFLFSYVYVNILFLNCKESQSP